MLQERILAGGAEGSGKTYAWLTIARALPKNKIYVIDPDDGVRRVWYKEFPEVNNIEYYFTPTWYTKDSESFTKDGPKAEKLDDGSNRKSINRAGTLDAWRLIKQKIKPGDWVILEHLHLLWNNIQGTFTDEIFDRDIGQYFLQARKAMKPGSKQLGALEGWTDWLVINKMHNDDLVNDICYSNPGHVFMTTSVTMIPKNAEESVELSAFYGNTRLRYEGQKHTPFRVQTKLIFKVAGKDDYRVSTFLKDRGREWLTDEKWSDFYFEYLVKVGGWE